jgi:iron complex transport system ATP-binding protein
VGFAQDSQFKRVVGYPMLGIQSLTVGYGARTVLTDISLSVAKGEVMALIGPNGSGKTTLIRAVSGVLELRAGQVLVDGKDIKHLSPAQRATRMAVMPQARNLPESFTVYQTVLLGRTPYLSWLGHPGEKDFARLEWALERTDTKMLADRLIGELSGGEQQRVLLARALAQDTPILLLDEPTAHLDINHQARLLNLVQELAREQSLAILMALHDLNLVALYADRVALLVNGSIAALGNPKEVLTPDTLALAYGIHLKVILHPDYGTPLVLPDGHHL